MDAILSGGAAMAERDRRITETVLRERGRLRSFIRRRIADPGEAEDLLQDVFADLVEAYRLPQSIEQVGAWLYRAARNRIVDRFRKKREVPLGDAPDDDDALEARWLPQVLPAADDGPEAALARASLLADMSAAIQDLPAEQREVFVAHEIEGQRFREMSAQSGVAVNTLLSRKHAAVQALRAALRTVHDDYFD